MGEHMASVGESSQEEEEEGEEVEEEEEEEEQDHATTSNLSSSIICNTSVVVKTRFTSASPSFKLSLCSKKSKRAAFNFLSGHGMTVA